MFINIEERANRLTENTSLKMYNYSDNKYVECSGKSYKRIKEIINNYNKVYNEHISCYDDYTRDATFIIFNN